MKKLFTALFCLSLLTATISLPLVVGGCGTTKQQAAYKTIYSVQAATVAAYNAYLDAVVSGKAPTNNVPGVSKKFNQFQSATIVALDAAQWNTNSPASEQLSTLSADLISLIQSFSK